MDGYDVFEPNAVLDNYVWHLKIAFDNGKPISSQTKTIIGVFLNSIFYYATTTHPCMLDDVLYFMYSWKNEGVNKKTANFIMKVIAEVKKLKDGPL
jgi:hypothetical protein